jgi:hypothetical protein
MSVVYASAAGSDLLLGNVIWRVALYAYVRVILWLVERRIWAVVALF